MMQHLIPAILAVPLIVAFASPLLGRAGARLRDAFVLLAFLALLPMTFMLWQQVSAYGAQNYVFGALSPAQTTVMLPSGYSLPVRIVLSVDALGAFAALLSAVVALSAVLYSLSFMGKAGRHFYPLLSLMALGMLGISFTGDLFNLFVFLEVLSISSAALVAYDRSRGEASEAAFKYLVVSAVAALFVLFAVALLYGQYGAVNIAFLAGLLQYSFLDKVALALLVAGLAMKVGAVPMHMWSPDAYGESPAPVTIMLVAASAVCLYALFRVCFSLFGFAADAAVVGWALIILGVLSMVVGVTMALVQKDIKRLMAYHCVSQIGYMLLGVGVGMAVLSDPVALASYGFSAVQGGLFHLLNNTLYKVLLFLTAGALFHSFGTRNLDSMRGAAHKMPLTTAFFLVGALAIAGIPPLNGFASKLVIYESVFLFNPLLSIIAMIVSILTLASFVKVFYAAFLGPKPAVPVKEVPVSMLLGMALLALLVILVGLFPDVVLSYVVKPAAASLVGQASYAFGVLGVSP